MNQNNDQQEFIYTYSAKDKDEIDRIRQKYQVAPQDSKLQRLHDLDSSVHSRGSACAIAVGTLGALIMGAGMSIVMTEFGQSIGLGAYAPVVGIAIGIIGLTLAICAYPIYRAVCERRKKKIAPEILSLIEELEQEQP